VHRPTEVSAPALPGTMYVVQAGAIYRFQHGAFKQITDESGWMQPSAAPDGRLVAVSRQPNFSDLYLLDGNGKVVSQLSHNSSTPTRSTPRSGSSAGRALPASRSPRPKRAAGSRRCPQTRS